MALDYPPPSTTPRVLYRLPGLQCRATVGRLLLSAVPSTTLRAVWVIFVGRPERDLSWAWPLLITPRTVDLGTPVIFAILSYPKSVALWRAKIAVFLSSQCCRWLCGGAVVSVSMSHIGTAISRPCQDFPDATALQERKRTKEIWLGRLETTYKNPPHQPRLNSTTINKEVKQKS